MREERQLIDRLDVGQRIATELVNVSIIANDRTRRLYLLFKSCSQSRAALIRMRAQVPFNLECSTTLHRCPRTIGDDCNTACAVNIFCDGFDLEYIFNAGNPLRRCRVKTFHPPAESSAAGNDCIQHPWDLRVQTKFRRTIRF